MILFFQALAVIILILLLAIFVVFYIKSKEHVDAYGNERDKKLKFRKSFASYFYPFIPRPNQERYKKTKRLLFDANYYKVSVELFYTIKWTFFVLVLFFLISVRTTNVFMTIDGIKGDINYKKVALDNPVTPTEDLIKQEIELYDFFDKDIKKSKDLYIPGNKDVYINYIKDSIIAKSFPISDTPDIVAKRIYYKLQSIRLLQSNYYMYFLMLVIAILGFFLPNKFLKLTIYLLDDTKDWEILSFNFIFSIFGRLPPQTLESVTENMALVADVYKPLTNEIYEGVKDNNSIECFNEILNKTDKHELFNLVEIMRMTVGTGIQKGIEFIDQDIENSLQSMKIKNIRRRESKKLLAMIPVSLLLIYFYLYFSISLTALSTPGSFINM